MNNTKTVSDDVPTLTLFVSTQQDEAVQMMQSKLDLTTSFDVVAPIQEKDMDDKHEQALSVKRKYTFHSCSSNPTLKYFYKKEREE